ncbi:ISSfl4 transposase OrfC [Escherichia coli O145:H28]|nr:ISSfl4 transposase OrfC [Escherichia coli O145:H28]GEG08916.1 ISSfl4 transposase OrfC [Escherichia coli O145:H28]GEI58258.1 ISSfl4 transposase OrfC [Escherichia coli O145:H28]
MLPSETMIWQPEFTDKTLSRKPGAVQVPVTIGKSHPGFNVTAQPVAAITAVGGSTAAHFTGYVTFKTVQLHDTVQIETTFMFPTGIAAQRITAHTAMSSTIKTDM